MRRPAPLAGAPGQWLDRWLFRHGRPESAPIVLAQRRIYVLPTRAGYAFALALLVMLIASINYNLNLGYALTFLLAGVAIASIVHAFRNLLHLAIRPGRAGTAFCGEDLAFHLQIDNPRPMRRPALRLRRSGASTDFELAANATAELTLTVPAPARGPLPLGKTVLETSWPLGLIRAWSVMIPDSTGLVYPAPEANPPDLSDCAAGEASGTRDLHRGDDDFAGLRPYQPADSPRHLAWKAYARGGELMTKQFSAHQGGELTLDWFALPEHLDVEARLSRLSAWIVRAERSAHRYALRLPDKYLPAGNGEPHRHQCLRALALHGRPMDEHDHDPG